MAARAKSLAPAIANHAPSRQRRREFQQPAKSLFIDEGWARQPRPALARKLS